MTGPYRGLRPITNGFHSEKKIFSQVSLGRTFPLVRHPCIPARLLLEAKQVMLTTGVLCTEDLPGKAGNQSRILAACREDGLQQ